MRHEKLTRNAARLVIDQQSILITVLPAPTLMTLKTE